MPLSFSLLTYIRNGPIWVDLKPWLNMVCRVHATGTNPLKTVQRVAQQTVLLSIRLPRKEQR